MSTSLLSDSLRSGRQARGSRLRRSSMVLALLLLALSAVALMMGQTFYSPAEVWGVLRGEFIAGASYTVGELRLPRTTLAVLAGMSFGISGVVFQTMLHNQLASPDIIGISSGAGAAGVVGIVFFHLSQTAVSLLALCVALLVAGSIYLFSNRGGFAGTRLILIGIGMAALLQSVVSYSLSRAASWDLPTVARWLSGSLNHASWQWAAPVAVAVVVIVPVLLILSHRLSVLRLSDDAAAGLGVPVAATRIALIIGAVALIAVATAACGPIAFVAFMAGPIAIRIVGPAASPIIPAALVGALLVLGADLLGQFAFDARYPVGVITGLLGAPYLIILLIRTHRPAGISS